jgi:hypothetical protein
MGLHAHFFESSYMLILVAFVNVQCPNTQSDKVLLPSPSVLNRIEQQLNSSHIFLKFLDFSKTDFTKNFHVKVQALIG